MKRTSVSKRAIAFAASLLPAVTIPLLSLAQASLALPPATKLPDKAVVSPSEKGSQAKLGDQFIDTVSDTDGTSKADPPSTKTSIEKVPRTVEERELVRKNEAAKLNNMAADHYELARHYIHKFDFEMAEVELEAAIMYVPGMKAAHRDYCLVSIMRGQGGRAGAELLMVVGLGDPIPLTDTEKTALVKKATKLHYQKGLNYGAKSAWKQATGEFLWARDYAPENGAITHSLAFSYAASGDFAHAQQEYEKSFESDPANAYSHADFAFLLAQHGDRQRALAELQNAVKLNPNVAALHVDVGWMAEAQGDLKLAESEFHKAVELSPHHAGLWSHLGQVEEHLGNNQGAKLAYGEALSIDPESNEAKERLKALGSAPGQLAPKESGPEEPKQDKHSSQT